MGRTLERIDGNFFLQKMLLQFSSLRSGNPLSLFHENEIAVGAMKIILESLIPVLIL